jgi:putative membrane protein
MKENKVVVEHFHVALMCIFITVFIWSLINPMDLFTWFLEVLPAVIGLILIIITYNRFRLTNIVYVLILIHSIILIIGGHYTYAEMPAFNWLRDTFDLSRNYYDRLGHFAQGFIPAIIMREILLRTSPLRRGKLLNILVICTCLAISASYELIEWGVAEATGSAADAFLGTQGDVWDTQWDMLFALIGSISSLLLLTRVHDKFLKQYNKLIK